MKTPRAMRWTQVPVGVRVIVHADGSQAVFEDEITSREAAKLLGIGLRQVQAICDLGKLNEGTDWRKMPGPNGRYHLKRSAVLKLAELRKGKRKCY